MSRFAKRLTVHKLCEEFIRWNKEKPIGFHFGQFMVLEYRTSSLVGSLLSIPDVYYEEDSAVAFGLIAQELTQSPISTDDSIPIWLRRQAN